MQVLRSVLYMPGSNSRALDKARHLNADAFIFDLEDAVAPSAKAEARDNILAALTEGGYLSQVVVRVNGLETSWWRDDLTSLVGLSCDAVLLPKPNSAEDVITFIEAMDELGLPKDLPVWLMAETPACIANAEAIFGAHARVSVVVMGTSDLGKELRLPLDVTRLGLQYALGRCLNAARLHGLDIVDGVFGDLQDELGFVEQCEQGRLLGFDGKSLIHPKQIDPANACFSPTETQIAESEAIVSAWKAAENDGAGIVVVNNRMIEELHVQQAKRVIAMADYIRCR